MKIDKDNLIIYLMEIFYKFTLTDHSENTVEYNKGYRKGMLDIIEAVNIYREK